MNVGHCKTDMKLHCDESCASVHAGLKEKKIYVGHREVAGIFSKVAIALRASGLEVEFVIRRPNTFGYKTQETAPKLVRLSRLCNPAMRGISADKPSYWLLMACSRILWDIWTLIAIFRYDYFIFTYGLSFWPWNFDLMLIKFLGKHAVLNFSSGSDARPPWMDGSFQQWDCSQKKSARRMVKLSRNIRRRLWISEIFAHRIIGSPMSTSQFARRDFVNSFYLGFPVFTPNPESKIEANYRMPRSLPLPSGALVALHAPSNPALKGTDEIRAIFRGLRSKFPQLFLRQIEGAKNEEVLREIDRADFIVDQLYSDTPLAVFASEAAAFAKPAVVGGYGWDEMFQFLPGSVFAKMRGSLCFPDELEATVTRFMQKRDLRLQLGLESKTVVSQFLAPEAVAHRYVVALAGTPPQEWIFSPGEVKYFLGAGQARSVTLRQIHGIVHHFGMGGLQISHNKPLSQAVGEFLDLNVKE
jgi:hypothetical protein